MKTAFAPLALAAIVAGCAQGANNVSTAYVSPLAYESYTCAQLREEAQRISNHVAAKTGVQNQKATNDAVAMGVGLVLFWPAIFFIGGDGETAAERSRLKGEMDAIEKTSIKKDCGIVFQKEPPPPAPTPAKGRND